MISFDDFKKEDLIPAIVQDINTKEVLMLAYMNEESLKKTLETGRSWFWSRSRQELWCKGETSGNKQFVKDVLYDCDEDTILLLVEQIGPACHTGNRTCFYRSLMHDRETKEADRSVLTEESEENVLKELFKVIEQRQAEKPQGSYTAELMGKGQEAVLKKINEEATEVVMAAHQPDNKQLVSEVADLLYHVLVLLTCRGTSFSEVEKELVSRRKK